ncbi:hypothetical protein JTB14_004806 [Gonioctena quinquepunctata]|nr:hypothetical protein JTB14_004806 [Gonioctena quinquepunctata]
MNFKFGYTTLRTESDKPKGTTLVLTFEPGTSVIEQSAVSTKKQAGKPTNSTKYLQRMCRTLEEANICFRPREKQRPGVA